jgi:hypothetical protein
MTEPAAWGRAAQRLPACGVTHGSDPGQLDEAARRLDHPELAVARRLLAEGHDVVSLAERGRRGPTPDFLVCGVAVEVKSLLTRAERGDGRPATAATIHNRLVSAAAQAAVVVVATEGSGIRAADAAAGLRSFVAAGRTGKVAAVRILGDGFDLGWVATPGREAGVQGGRGAGRSAPERSERDGGADRVGRDGRAGRVDPSARHDRPGPVRRPATPPSRSSPASRERGRDAGATERGGRAPSSPPTPRRPPGRGIG